MQLMCDGVAVASVEVADSWLRRLKGLLGRSSFDGAMFFDRTSSVHTIGMRFPIDVAFCDSSLRVIDVMTMKPYRVCRPRRAVRSILEAPVGTFSRWGLRVGSVLELQP